MTRGLKIGVWIGIGTVVAAIAIYAQGWYYDRYTWPKKIQREILGKVIVEHSALLTYEGFSHFGQGGFQWTYRFEPSNPAVAEFCGIQPVERCHFQRTGKPAPHVETAIVYDARTLVVEEDWL